MVYSDVYSLIKSITDKGKWQEKLDDEEIQRKWANEFISQGGSKVVFDLSMKVLELMNRHRGGSCCHECCGRVREFFNKRGEREEAEEEDSEDDESDEDGMLARRCECPCEHCRFTRRYEIRWECICIEDGWIDAALTERLKASATRLEAELPIDWHPGSEGIIRN